MNSPPAQAILEEPVCLNLASKRLLERLLAGALIVAADWDSLPHARREQLMQCSDNQALLDQLVEFQLLTKFQAGAIRAGKTEDLILGKYRVLDRLGSGGVCVVYKAEHLRLRRAVAIKVLPVSRDEPPRHLQRFHAEVRIVSRLRHPNIVAALDAGEIKGTDPEWPIRHYFVMEYVPGQNLEHYVQARGPLPVARSCDFIHQIAAALAELHRHDLIHRDVKPSNILITPERQAKLVDFGLVRHFDYRVTRPRTGLGTPMFMAPEQAMDASTVNLRADLYGLGATLFWCLTGQPPFSWDRSVAQVVARQLSQPPPSARALRAEIPLDVDTVVARMMAIQPEDRYVSAQEVMTALEPFLFPEARERALTCSDS